MRLTITIDLDGAAFEHSREMYNVLRHFAVYVNPRPEDGPGSGKLQDSNGNTCGEWKVSE